MHHRPMGDPAFQSFLNEEKLMGSRCNSCEQIYTPPRLLCTRCYATDQEWVAMAGSGKLAAFTCISIVPKKMRLAGYGRNNPYCVGVVTLDEGPRVVARIVGVDTMHPERIAIGTPMTVHFLHLEQEGVKQTLLAFKPAAI